jgi:hypothetical protein
MGRPTVLNGRSAEFRDRHARGESLASLCHEYGVSRTTGWRCIRDRTTEPDDLTPDETDILVWINGGGLNREDPNWPSWEHRFWETRRHRSSVNLGDDACGHAHGPLICWHHDGRMRRYLGRWGSYLFLAIQNRQWNGHVVQLVHGGYAAVWAGLWHLEPIAWTRFNEDWTVDDALHS